SPRRRWSAAFARRSSSSTTSCRTISCCCGRARCRRQRAARSSGLSPASCGSTAAWSGCEPRGGFARPRRIVILRAFFLWRRPAVSTLPPLPFRPRTARLVLFALVAALPAACITPPPAPRNPFLGAWSTAERSHIAFRDDTVVINQPDAPPTAMSPQSCPQGFQFGYGRKSREALLALAGAQADLGRRLASMLVQPEYPAAELR